jgi:GAF domain-containing protein
MSNNRQLPRERRLVEALVALSDTLVNDYDVNELLHLLVQSCVTILDMEACGVLLTDPDGRLCLAAASSRDMRMLELFEMQQKEGPCYDAFTSSQPVAEKDLTWAAQRWRRFGPEAQALGLGAVYAFPMRLRGQVIGALNMFQSEPGRFAEADVRAGQALADITTIGILHERRVVAAEQLAAQLQHALHSRVVIEQAKGVLSERLGMEMDEAFSVLRRYSRSRNRRLREVAAEVVGGSSGPRRSRPPEHA